MRELHILRGVSGSGKSRRAREIVSGIVAGADPHGSGLTGIICSADHFFDDGEGYVFDYSKLKEAHKYCQSEVEKSMKSDIPIIVVDNTNMRYWEMLPYVNMAAANKYIHKIELVGTLKPSDLDLYAHRNQHGTTVEKIYEQAANFDQWEDAVEGFRIQRAISLLEGGLRHGDRKTVMAAATMLSFVIVTESA